MRSERQLVEQISYNLPFRRFAVSPFRRFVGLCIEDAAWNHSLFSENRDRPIEYAAATELFKPTVQMARSRGLLSGE